MDKRILRAKIKKIREELSFERKNKLSEIIIENFLGLEEVKKAKTIMSYMDIKNEVETKKLNKRLRKLGKKVLLPSIDSSEIKVYEDIGGYKKSKFGVLEPFQKEYKGDIDIIIVPGIVFNLKGDRIGFGKGYYDKFLSADIYQKSLKISIVYNFQLLDNFVGEKFDQKIDIIIKENGVLKFLNVEK
ncbi:5-formyltetrahydrofolate cyclo-ligase [Fusobacterium sp. MFO224]|uniref:5-formyltetrahydrofolate cyclo-ligase n=1 Tax=Fusobacterium sp. MFO224 TaxID=3378070 RepID=UPI003853F3C1